jgi:prepilin-type N-terminal cleavage/methylation domain-containing protein
MLKERSFTLLELIITCVIIGILTSIAVPQFTALKHRAYRAEAYAQLGKIRAAIQRYVTARGLLNPPSGLTFNDLDVDDPSDATYGEPNRAFNYSFNATYAGAVDAVGIGSKVPVSKKITMLYNGTKNETGW